MIKFKKIIQEISPIKSIIQPEDIPKFTSAEKQYINSLKIFQNPMMGNSSIYKKIEDHSASFEWWERLSLEPRKSKIIRCEVHITKYEETGLHKFDRTEFDMDKGGRFKKARGVSGVISVWYKRGDKTFFRYGISPLFIPIPGDNSWLGIKAIKELLREMESRLKMQLFEKI